MLIDKDHQLATKSSATSQVRTYLGAVEAYNTVNDRQVAPGSVGSSQDPDILLRSSAAVRNRTFTVNDLFLR